MAKLGDKCRQCGEVITETNSADVDEEGFRFHYQHHCVDRLMSECARVRNLMISARGEAEWSLAAADPHDWRKGLEIIKTKLESELDNRD